MMLDDERDYNISKIHDEEILEDVKRGIVSEHKIHALSRMVILNRSFYDRRFDPDYSEKLILAMEEGLLRRKLMTKSFISKFELRLWPPYLKIERQRYLDKVDI